MTMPRDWLPPFPPSDEHAEYNQAHRDAFIAFAQANPQSTWEERNAHAHRAAQRVMEASPKCVS